MYSTASKIYEFEGFRLIPLEGLLLHDGERIDLNPKAFGVLVMLVEHHGHLVSKSDILDHVWNDAFIEEAAISKAVWFIRTALGDNSKERFIQTVPRRGYRFVAPVKVLNDAPDAEARSEFISTGYRLPQANGHELSISPATLEAVSSNVDPGADGRVEESFPPGPTDIDKTLVRTTAQRSRRLAAYVGFALVAVAAIGIYLSFGGSGILGRGGTSRIAIIPLKPVDAGARDPAYELGIADSLIMKLAASPDLRVTQLSSVRGYTELERDPIRIGKEQNVDYVLYSHYQVADGRIKVTSQLFDVASGRVEDTFTAENKIDHLFAIQKSIADGIGDRVLARFASVKVDVRPRRGTDNDDAYRYYQLAMNIGEERGIQNVRKSLEYLELAIAADPNYAAAWAAKAHIHRDIVGHSDEDQTFHYQKSMEAVEKALAIDPKLSDAYSAICINKNRYEYDVWGADAACKRAIELDPSSPVAHKSYANFLYSRGRFDEAIAEIKVAIDLQPVSYRNQQIYGLALHYARRYDDAERQFKHLLELNPNHSFIHSRLVRIFEEQGKDAEAFKYFIEMRTLQNTESQKIDKLRKLYEKGGWRAVKLEAIRETEEDKDPRHFLLACMYAMTGDKDKALMSLEKAYEERSFMMAVIQVEPQLDSVRDDPRYEALIKKIGLPPTGR